MAHISRPFQIALVAVGLFASVWFVALRGHSSSTGGSGSAPAESASRPAHSTSGPTAPGVAGLGKDVEKARGAVATSQQNATQLEHKSAQASGDSSPAATTSAPAGRAPAKAAAPSATKSPSAPSKAKSNPARAKAPAKPATKSPSASGVPAREQSVEAQLAHGDVVLLLFWNPKGIDDKAVRKQVHAAAGRNVVVQEATAGEAAQFGTITRGVQLYSTPTVLVINGKGQAQVISGLTDAYALRQAVAEARHG